MTIPSHHQIAMRSYLIWEEEGRPHGQDVDHWLQAETELTALFNPPPKPLDGRAGKKPQARAKVAGKASPQKKSSQKKAAAKGEGKTAKPASLQH